MQIDVVLGDITTQQLDAIVNAANEALIAGGGVDGAIHEAAGEEELAAALSKLGRCAVGDAVATAGFALPARWIIHTVGPIYRGGRHGEAEQLASCYRRCLEVADELGARSVAFPAISTGAFGYPEREASAVAVRTLRAADTRVELVRLVAFERSTRSRYLELLERPGPT